MRNAKACWDSTHLQGSIANICHVHAVSQLCRVENAYDSVIYNLPKSNVELTFCDCNNSISSFLG